MRKTTSRTTLRLSVGLGVLSLTALAACSSDSSSKPTPAGNAASFASVTDIIRTDCAKSGCHPNYTTQAVFDDDASESLSRIQKTTGTTGAMPQDWKQASAYASTANGIALKKYLESVTD